jgi:hypothetical protein
MDRMFECDSPEDLDTQTKLWGTEADLRATAQFVASTDLRI